MVPRVEIEKGEVYLGDCLLVCEIFFIVVVIGTEMSDCGGLKSSFPRIESTHLH